MKTLLNFIQNTCYRHLQETHRFLERPLGQEALRQEEFLETILNEIERLRDLVVRVLEERMGTPAPENLSDPSSPEPEKHLKIVPGEEAPLPGVQEFPAPPRGAGKYHNGSFAGYGTLQSVVCGTCQKRRRAYAAVAEGWADPTWCGCETVVLREEARPGIPAEFEGLTDYTRCVCKTCGRMQRVRTARNHWISPIRCDRCDPAEVAPIEEKLAPVLAVTTIPTPEEETAGEKEDRLSLGGIPSGPFQGLRLADTVMCLECEIVRPVFEVRGSWPSPYLCSPCQEKGKRPPAACEGLWQRVRRDEPLTCIGCRQTRVAHAVWETWPLPDLCDACAAEAEPQAPPLCAHCRKRPPLPQAIYCKPCAEEHAQIAFQEFQENMSPLPEPVVAPATDAEAPPESRVNPFSRKRPFAIGQEKNFREKRLVREHKAAHA